MENFDILNLPAPLKRALSVLNFSKPTPIQSQAIPVALEGKDVIGCAQTGTGKTAAYSLPILTRLLDEPENCGLVLVPTRELAMQVDTLWRQLIKFLPDSHKWQAAIVIGGSGMPGQIKALSRRPKLIIATPGRLVDHLNRRTASLRNAKYLVLDEADRMLDMGFLPQLTQVLKHMPAERQTLFFTATWERQMDELSKRYLKSPVKVTIGTVSKAATQVDQSLIMTSVQKKNEILLHEVTERDGLVLIFARTKSRTDRVARFLNDKGLKANRIHGDRTQGQRNSALQSFRSGKIRILVATDIAARGIDISDVAHVVNYDLPQCSEDYIHRIGRTGRAGATGKALSLVTPEDKGNWRQIVRLLQRTGSQIPQTLPGIVLQ